MNQNITPVGRTSRPTLNLLINSFSRRQMVAFWLFNLVLVGSAVWGLWQLNNYALLPTPARGGKLTEGIIGSPRFINPVLAISDADKDLTALVYSGLMRLESTGNYMPDLATDYEMTSDGKSYTFKLKNNLVWQDGQPLTTDDIMFTIAKVKDPAIKSPRWSNWDGVEVEKLDEHTVKFVLKHPFAGFLDNATLGILPKHLWKDSDAESFQFNPLNQQTIGSGPYAIDRVKKNSDNVPEWYQLKSFRHFALGQAKIDQVTIRFYPNEERLVHAYERGEVDSLSAVAPVTAVRLEADGARVMRAPLARVFAVFLNHNQTAIFTQPEVRRLLTETVNRSALIKTVLAGFGSPATGPLTPSTNTGDLPVLSPAEVTSLLTQNGWSQNDDGGWHKKINKEEANLAFTLTTANTVELTAAAKTIKHDWEAWGAKVDVQFFESGDLNPNVIRPRKYAALLFGEITGRLPDPYYFWHSSQRLDPGPNIALYANPAVDKILEEMRVTTDPTQRVAALAKFEAAIQADRPAVFLYAPDFIYIVPAKLGGLKLPTLNHGAERWVGIHQWYVKTDRVWPIFAK
ncbi:MAG: ABC transporter substrate-binding protein [Patescibacteria group bacterium]